MRYTTLIDISQARQLYSNHNVRLVYLHMVLKAGYHDNDKDIVVTSVRRLADEVGITVSATRHALKQLAKWQMIRPGKGAYSVRKWCPEQPITTRAKTAKQQQQQERDAAAAAERRSLAKQQRDDKRYFEDLKAKGLTSLDAYKLKLKEAAAMGDEVAAERLKKLGG